MYYHCTYLCIIYINLVIIHVCNQLLVLIHSLYFVLSATGLADDNFVLPKQVVYVHTCFRSIFN